MFRRKIQNEKTTILLLITESMKNSYLQYGDENTRIMLFGMCTIQYESSQYFQTMFEFFFEIMEHPPETILTDDQKAIGTAIQRLKSERKYNYVHLLDWFHKTQAVKRQLRKEPCG